MCTFSHLATIKLKPPSWKITQFCMRGRWNFLLNRLSVARQRYVSASFMINSIKKAGFRWSLQLRAFFIFSFVNLFFSQIIMDLFPYVCFEPLRKKKKKTKKINKKRLTAERGNRSVTNSSSECNVISSNHEYVNASN